MAFDPKDYLGVNEAAAKLDVSDTQIKVWCRQGRIKAVKIGIKYVIAKKDCVRPKPRKSWSSAESRQKVAASAKQRVKRTVKKTTSKKGKTSETRRPRANR